jgi:hypothetical protein
VVYRVIVQPFLPPEFGESRATLIQAKSPQLGFGRRCSGLSFLRTPLPLYFAFVFFAMVAAYEEPSFAHSIIHWLPEPELSCLEGATVVNQVDQVRASQFENRHLAGNAFRTCAGAPDVGAILPTLDRSLLISVRRRVGANCTG